MPNQQPNFPLRQDAYTLGQAVKSRYGSDAGVAETAGGIAFGAAIMRGSVDGAIGLFDGTRTFLGIAKLDHGARGNGLVGASAGYAQNAPMAYFTSGHVAVLADAAINALDAQVRFNTATGRFTNAAASGTVLDCTGWTFDSVSTAAGQIIVIKR